MTARWIDQGASWTEGSLPLLVTVWEGITLESIAAVLLPDVESARVTWEGTSLPADRIRHNLVEVDFILDTRQQHPLVPTDYWAPDDPWWAEHGFDDPEFLGYVQHLAGVDAEVADALENGRHDEVMTIIEWIDSHRP